MYRGLQRKLKTQRKVKLWGRGCDGESALYIILKSDNLQRTDKTLGNEFGFQWQQIFEGKYMEELMDDKGVHALYIPCHCRNKISSLVHEQGQSRTCNPQGWSLVCFVICHFSNYTSPFSMCPCQTVRAEQLL